MQQSALEVGVDVSIDAYRPLSISIYVQDLTVIAQFTVTMAAAVQTVSPALAAVMQS